MLQSLFCLPLVAHGWNCPTPLQGTYTYVHLHQSIHFIFKQSCRTQSNQNLNLKTRCLFYEPTYLSGPCCSLTTLSYFPSLPLLANFFSFLLFFVFPSQTSVNPDSYSFSVASRIPLFQYLVSLHTL